MYLNAIASLLMIILSSLFVSLIISIVAFCYQLDENKNKPFYQLESMKFIVINGIKILIIGLLVFALYCLNNATIQEVGVMSEALLSILVNIGTSVLVTVITSIGVYFKFLKKLPEETKDKVDKLLNERLNYETVNHNASLQKSDSVRESLSREHSELSKNILNVISGVDSLQSGFDNERKMKEIEYNHLHFNEKEIIDSINNLSTLGETLKKLNLENEQLTSKLVSLQSENDELRIQLSRLRSQDTNAYRR